MTSRKRDSSGRSDAERQHDLDNIDQAHIQNEAARDSFLAVAHTALFAASIAFLGNLPPTQEREFAYLIVVAWAANAIGLFALCVSFEMATLENNRARSKINQVRFREAKAAWVTNRIALWSFPAALVFTFAFATANVLK